MNEKQEFQTEENTEPVCAPFDPTDAVRPVKRVLVPQTVLREIAEESLFSDGIARLQDTADTLFRLLNEKSDDPLLEIAYTDIMITKSADFPLLLQNFRRLKTQINDSYHSYGTAIKSAGEVIVNTPFPVNWRFPTVKEARYLYEHKAFHYIRSNIVARGVTLSDKLYIFFVGGNSYSYNNEFHHMIADIYVASVVNTSMLTFIIEKGLLPEMMQNQESRFQSLSRFVNEEYISIQETSSGPLVEVTPKLREKIHSGSIKEIAGVTISEQTISERMEQLKQGGVVLSEEQCSRMVQSILRRDFVRANITPYDPMMLEDPNRGSWELWDAGNMPGCCTVSVPKTFYARDPRKDIQQGGVVGIDFGTKSTVVVYRDQSGVIQPMRIGMGEFDRALRQSDYENPTVMQFLDIEAFETAYRGGSGRPLTSWENLTVSHTAFNAWKDSEKSNDFFSFFGELKQWAGSPNRQVRIRDPKGYEISLPPYSTLEEGDFDPIERYAYYVGLYINNMHTGRIYLEYLLSFPVTYSQKVRARLLSSFRSGLQRSLPQAVLSDPACMRQFRVEQGAGEPAAYAVCALQEYRIVPKPEESILYGVFDFGGGTTDFDFGIWRRAAGAKERRYNYVIQHFGGSGDPYLGGENLLELLAFETFKDNRDALLAEKITFALPPQCRRFPGSEALIHNSQEAHSNLRKLMEALRPLWERHEGYAEIYKDNALKLQLFRQDGRPVDGFQLQVDTDKLETLIRTQIEKCVKEFFDALLSIFTGGVYESVRTARTHGQIHLFLAGNSSKSEILKEVFNEAIQSYNEKYNDILEQDGIVPDADNSEHFKLFFPLGTPESDKQLQGLGVTEEPDAARPNGKTGVAYGLVQCRKGSKIKAVSEKPETEEIRFRYWVGDDADGQFAPILSRETEYQQWVEYIDAGVDRFEFYYTASPSAERNLPTSETLNAHLQIPEESVNEDWMVYLRAVSPDTLEYVVAESQEAANAGEYRSEIRKFVLSEG